MDNAIIKNYIRKKRIEKGYSQSEVASMMKISQTSYQKIEKGGTALISERLPQIASILEVSEAELVLGYLPDETIYIKKLEELKEESLLKESTTIKELRRQLSDKDKRIEELVERIKDKDEIISYQREKLKQSQE